MLRTVLTLALCATGTCFAATAPHACFATVQAAVEGAASNAVPTLRAEGFRVLSVREDKARNRNWAIVEDCAHPAATPRAIPLDRSLPVSALQPRTIVVHVGQPITIFRNGADSSLRLAGHAREAGAVGETIHVDLASLLDPNQHVTLSGRIACAGVVELQP